MGFDLVGLKPASEAGRSFSRNIHGWTPLWHFICQNCDDILTAPQMEEGFLNDGIRISARQTKLIVERLENIMNSKPSVPKNKGLKSDVIEFLEFARHSGGFKIW